jgi:hypothetical protein
MTYNVSNFLNAGLSLLNISMTSSNLTEELRELLIPTLITMNLKDRTQQR